MAAVLFMPCKIVPRTPSPLNIEIAQAKAYQMANQHPQEYHTATNRKTHNTNSTKKVLGHGEDIEKVNKDSATQQAKHRKDSCINRFRHKCSTKISTLARKLEDWDNREMQKLENLRNRIENEVEHLWGTVTRRAKRCYRTQSNRRISTKLVDGTYEAVDHSITGPVEGTDVDREVPVDIVDEQTTYATQGDHAHRALLRPTSLPYQHDLMGKEENTKACNSQGTSDEHESRASTSTDSSVGAERGESDASDTCSSTSSMDSRGITNLSHVDEALRKAGIGNAPPMAPHVDDKEHDIESYEHHLASSPTLGSATKPGSSGRCQSIDVIKFDKDVGDENDSNYATSEKSLCLDGELADDEETERQAIWGPILAIEECAVKSLASTFVHRPPSEVTSVSTKAGQNNKVFILRYEGDDDFGICIRIPACGWGAKWTDNDKQQLRHTVDTMKFLAKNTSIPIPQILHHDVSFDNAIGAPYIAMSCMQGVHPLPVWFPEGSAGGSSYWVDKKTGDEVNNPNIDDIVDGKFSPEFKPLSNALEDKRQTMLRTMATYVAELRKFSFDARGSPIFSENGESILGVGPSSSEHFGVCAKSDRSTHPKVQVIPACDDMRSDHANKLAEWDAEMRNELVEKATEKGWLDEQKTYALRHHTGVVALFRMILECLPDPDPEPFCEGILAKSPAEAATHSRRSKLPTKPFVLAPPDFHCENVLCDADTGAVTAILDWDRITTRPRHVGWCLVPDWLRVDYEDNALWCRHPIEGKTMHTEDYVRYRNDYAQYLQDACEADGNVHHVDDWKFTQQSPLIYKVLNIIDVGEAKEAQRIARIILHDLFPRSDADDTITDVLAEPLQLGMKAMFKARLSKYLGLISDDELRAALRA